MNYTTARCGHQIIAEGAPGSSARKACERRTCGKPRCVSGLPAKFTDRECEAYVFMWSKPPWAVFLTKGRDMLTPDERQMVADAERSLKLQGAASDGPWESEYSGGGDWRIIESQDNFVAEVFSFAAQDDAAFIANSRTDPSAANVLTLAEEVERLRGIARRATPQPCYFSAAFTRSYFERVDKELRREHAQQCIDACRIHGVEVPEHLKPYERSES